MLIRQKVGKILFFRRKVFSCRFLGKRLPRRFAPRNDRGGSFFKFLLQLEKKWGKIDL
jgi:hypothetical protein